MFRPAVLSFGSESLRCIADDTEQLAHARTWTSAGGGGAAVSWPAHRAGASTSSGVPMLSACERRLRDGGCAPAPTRCSSRRARHARTVGKWRWPVLDAARVHVTKVPSQAGFRWAGCLKGRLLCWAAAARAGREAPVQPLRRRAISLDSSSSRAAVRRAASLGRRGRACWARGVSATASVAGCHFGGSGGSGAAGVARRRLGGVGALGWREASL